MSKTNGRAAPPEKLESFTFQDTGRTVQIRKVSTLIRAEVELAVVAANPEPEPPMTEVDYGDGTIRTPNPASPTYQQLMRAWEARITAEQSERLKKIALTRGVVVDAIDTEAVAQARQDLAAIGVDTSQYDDRYVYLAFVCIGSEDDWTDLLKAVFQRAAPSEAAIQAHIDTFRGDVRGQEHLEPGAQS